MSDELGLTTAAAQLLDGVRLLTTFVTDATGTPAAATIRKIWSTASWLCSKAEKYRPGGDGAVTEAVHVATFIYTWSVMKLRPMSGFDDEDWSKRCVGL